jgi:hypothetical protein
MPPCPLDLSPFILSIYRTSPIHPWNTIHPWRLVQGIVNSFAADHLHLPRLIRPLPCRSSLGAPRSARTSRQACLWQQEGVQESHMWVSWQAEVKTHSGVSSKLNWRSPKSRVRGTIVTRPVSANTAICLLRMSFTLLFTFLLFWTFFQLWSAFLIF